MIGFNPTDLKDKVLLLIDKFSFIRGNIDEINFSDLLDVAKYDDYDVTIDENSEVCVYLGEGNDPRVSLRHLMSIYSLWEDSKLNERQSYARSKHEVEFLIQFCDSDTYSFLESFKAAFNSVVRKTPDGVELWPIETKIDDIIYHVSLYNGLCIYHLLVEESGNTDKYLPAYSEDDYFVRITSDSEIDFKVADSLALSFIFELQATHNIIVTLSEGRVDFCAPYLDEEDFEKQSYGIFPLLYGRGIKELLELYSTAKTSVNVDYKILGFTKVIEYISPTISKEELLKSTRLKLTSPDIFAPTSEYIIELGDIFKKHQNDISKDSELIKIGVMTVTQLSDVWNCLPKYIKPKNLKNIEMLDEDKKKLCFENLVAAIYDTRNEIAHAKANYEKKGLECPGEDRVQFSEVLDRIAVRCIRWFAMQPEERRIVLS